MDEQDVVATTAGHVRMLRINRPQRANALSANVSRLLVAGLLAANDDPDVRVIVITGTGERTFCAGADLKEVREADHAGAAFRPPMQRAERAVLEVVLETYKPTIAALNGHAVAGGFELALGCDLRIAAEGVQVGMPEAKIGMGANFASVILPKRLPMAIALQMLFTGEYITAERAATLGLINEVVPRERLAERVGRLAEQIAGNAPLSVRRMKEMALKGADLPTSAALRLDVGPNPYTSEDRKEGVQAYLERRPPVWQGR
ncbi:MAG: enoyl-CoA hydratase/isomerase family protein [Chloroflexi bacterium]|nr:enoyl-CoA hydratase/isomerase family protein [Chloroflexota bacterium]